MRFARRSGILLHLTSLPSRFGVGDLGEAAFRFVEFLNRAGQQIWQVLPLSPTSKGNSPYTCSSAFAGNPLMICPKRLVMDGMLDDAALQDTPDFAEDEVSFDAVRQFKNCLLQRSFDMFGRARKRRRAFDFFCHKNRSWLHDFALFESLRDEFGTGDWSAWEPEVVRRNAKALQHWELRLATRIEFSKYVQFMFSRQWQQLKAFAKGRVEIFGDLPIFVAYESADVWAHPTYFWLDEAGKPTVVAGVPPDDFSATGQLWENPLYNWDELARANFDWWVERLRHAFSLFGMLRVDHFRGFESYWEVPADAPTALHGRWVKGPGAAPFRAAERKLGELRIVAEDLGSITSEVLALRDDLRFPGMRVLQFGFENGGNEYHQPHTFPQHCAAYTGTHDNDTVVGWFRRRASTQSDDRVMKYLGTDGHEIHWDLCRLVLSSAADTAIVPLQDVLGLGSEARMNVPGRSEGNWKWRYREEMLTREVEERLRRLTTNSERYTAQPHKHRSAYALPLSHGAGGTTRRR